jgi:hypothetical protein
MAKSYRRLFRECIFGCSVVLAIAGFILFTIASWTGPNYGEKGADADKKRDTSNSYFYKSLWTFLGAIIAFAIGWFV